MYQDLTRIVQRLSDLIAGSDPEASPYVSVNTWREIREQLAGYLVTLDQDSFQQEDARNLSILLAPTGSAQELAMANGWVDEYLDLSARFDELTAR